MRKIACVAGIARRQSNVNSVTRLLLVARPGPLADGLLGLLARIPGVEIVGPVDDLPSVLLAMSQLGPATLVIDSGPFGEQVSAVVRQLGIECPGSRCIVLADDVHQQRAVQRAGADAALLKGCPPAELVATVRGLLVAGPGL